MRPYAVPVLVLAPLLACGEGPGATGFSTGPGVSSMPPAGSESSSSTTAVGTTASDDDSTSTSPSAASSTGDDAPKLDMSVPDGGDVPPIGCAGKIDFLFAVSADSTMASHQQQLIAAFPQFIAAIESKLPGFDVHILSAATHPLWAFDDCADCIGPECDPQAGLPFCGVQPEFCDKGKIGASVTMPVGKGASNRRCELHGGNRFIVGDEPDRAGAFACIAQTGLSGANLVAEAMVRGLGSEWVDGPNKCNKGFLRDDALLVVVLISDTFDQFSGGTVQEWTAALRAAKHGDDDAFAVLVLTTDIDAGDGPYFCEPGGDGTTNRLRQLANSVEHGFIGSICAESYGPFFAETVSHIVSLCDGFVVPQ